MTVSPKMLGFLLPTGGQQQQQWGAVVTSDGQSVGTTSGLCLYTSLEVQWLHIPPRTSLHPSAASPTLLLGVSDPALGGTGVP